ncbi:hypothetical protein BJV82DRAFT_526379 [Fennellomyces sp. T-0311]|nr:hypothetical protein BJV82DRAFT_526379 [Fennellomyces sp. T-0311]
MELHDLLTRPRYDWQPNQLLFELLPSLDQPVFRSPLSDDDWKALVDRYPPVSSVVYQPSAALPQAKSQFKPGHHREDSSLKALQYATSAILRPLDVLAHMLLPLLPQEHYARIFTIINDVRTLVLNAGGVANQARNQLALRAVNPSFSIPNPDKSFTMSLDQFKDTVASHTAMHKAMWEARPSNSTTRRTGDSSSFFRGVPPPGGDQVNNLASGLADGFNYRWFPYITVLELYFLEVVLA